MMGLSFDDSTREEAHWPVSAKDYASGNLTVDVMWYAANATSGTVIWQLRLEPYTPETATSSVEALIYANPDAATDTHLGTQSKRMMKASHTLSGAELNSIAAGDIAWLGLTRLTSDTMSNDAVVERVEVSEA
jgi:hypothetical protein